MNILLTTLISLVMTYEMPKLPYANNGLEPVISQATIDYHYGKHLQTYVNNLNSLAPSTEFEGKTVEEIVASAPDGAIFNNAGQVLNHTLYFLQFTPKPNKHEPSAVYVGHPFVLRWQRYGKEMNNATTDCFIFCGRMFFYDYLALCLFILVKG
jgi:superoxide dismutase, Fe-Mn family